MRNFKQKNRSGGRSNFHRQSFSGRDNSRSMYKATCAECGNECEVPFKPRGDKPVFCNSCFKNKRDRNQNARRSGFAEKRMFAVTCNKCGKACEVPFRPSEDKPIYCNDCFGKNGNKKDWGGSNEQFNKQFDILNSKLDQILKALVTSSAKNPASKKGEIKSVKKAEKSSPDKLALNRKTVKKAITKKTGTKKVKK
jgi:CxxC-x17-CxxC domain-containing protein